MNNDILIILTMSSPAFTNTSTALKMQSSWLNKIYDFIHSRVNDSASNGLFKHHFVYDKNTQSFVDNSQWPPVKYPLSYPMLTVLKDKMSTEEYNVTLSPLAFLRRKVDVKISWKPQEFMEVVEHSVNEE